MADKAEPARESSSPVVEEAPARKSSISSAEVDEKKAKQPNVEVESTHESKAAGIKGADGHIQWPEEQPLIVSGFTKFALNLYDFVLVLIPLLLVVKVGGCISVNGIKENNAFADGLVKFNRQLVTLYTVLFVIIVATFMRRLALYRAQRGDFIHNLEQYQASITMTSALKTVWSLRAFTLQSLGIILLWSFYYVGSQAVQRELTHDPQPVMRQNTTSYLQPKLTRVFDVDAQGNPIAAFNVSFAYAFPEIVPYLYNSALLNHVNNPYIPMDGWGNVRMPMMETSTAPADEEGWHYFQSPRMPQNTIWAQQAEQWLNTFLGPKGGDSASPGSGTEGDFSSTRPSHASFVGIPAYIPPKHDYVVYNLNTSYLYFNCSSFQPVDPSKLPTLPTDSMNMTMMENVTLFMTTNDTVMKQRSDTQNYSSPIPLSLYLVPDTRAFLSNCTVDQTFVEMLIECQFSNCEALKARKDNSTINRLKGKTALDVSSAMVLDAVISTFPFASGISHGTNVHVEGAHLGVLESYMDLQRVQPLKTIEAFLRQPKWSDISPTNVSVRLTQLVNSYLQIAMSPNDMILNLDETVSLADFTALDTKNEFTQAPATTITLETTYRIQMWWIVLDIINCLILATVSIISWYLRLKTLAPDIFGYVSSLTRENPHFQIPEGGTRLSGFERARLMKSLRVRIGDVGEREDDAEAGKVGFGDASEETRAVKMLDKARRYL